MALRLGRAEHRRLRRLGSLGAQAVVHTAAGYEPARTIRRLVLLTPGRA